MNQGRVKHLVEKWTGIPARPGPWDDTFDRHQRGAWGEQWAAYYYYHQRNAAVLFRNWRGGGPEVDLIVRDGDTLVFVEVKTRDPDDPDPLHEVRDDRRVLRLQRAAQAYLRDLPKPRPALRFDALLVTPNHQPTPQIDCLTNLLDHDGDDEDSDHD